MAVALHAAHGSAPADTHADPDGKLQGEPGALTHEHLGRLLELERALACACEHADIAIIAGERTRTLTGASAAQLAELRDGGGLAVVAEATRAASALPPTTPSWISPDAPEHDVVQRRAPVWIGSRAELAERGPRLAPDALAGGPDAVTWAFLPLVASGEVRGVLTLAFDEVRVLDGPTRAFLDEVAVTCGGALARSRLLARAHARASASEKARAAGEVRERNSERRFGDRTRLYERERFARARAEAETAVAVRTAEDLEHARRLSAAPPASVFVAEYEESGVEGPLQRILGVFSSETSARDAARALDRERSLVVQASITSWVLDVPGPGTRLEPHLPE